MSVKVAIIGSRNCKDLTWHDLALHIPKNCAQIISGGAAGVDSLAREAAEKMGIPIVELLPDYGSYGARAPLLRDTEIVEASDMVLAFWDLTSRGTAYTLNECIRLQVPLRIIPLGERMGELELPEPPAGLVTLDGQNF